MSKAEMPTHQYGACRGCGADIVWAVTEKGKRVPLNPKSEKRFIFTSWPQIEPTLVTLMDTYVSHFATCPKAEEFRK